MCQIAAQQCSKISDLQQLAAAERDLHEPLSNHERTSEQDYPFKAEDLACREASRIRRIRCALAIVLCTVVYLENQGSTTLLAITCSLFSSRVAATLLAKKLLCIEALTVEGVICARPALFSPRAVRRGWSL